MEAVGKNAPFKYRSKKYKEEGAQLFLVGSGT